jgi:quinol monooxygenase YgiN
VPTARDYPGCLYFALTQDMLDPGLVHVCERWVDEDAFVAHLRTAHAARIGDFMRKIQLMDATFLSYVAEGENLLMG